APGVGARRPRPPLGSDVRAGPPHATPRSALPARRGSALVTQQPALIDSHSHVAEPEFDDDRDAVLARAAAAGVPTVVCVGAVGRVDNNGPTLALAGTRAGVRVVATVGIHPHDAATADDAALATLRGMAAADGVVALGETGLDYHYQHSPRAAQLDAFARTAALAREL